MYRAELGRKSMFLDQAPILRLSSVVLCVMLAAALSSCADSNQDRDGEVQARSQVDSGAGLGNGLELGSQTSLPVYTD